MQMKKRRALWLATLGLLVLFAQATSGACALSFTYDEPIYIGAGYADWMTGDVRMHGFIGHPPLINMLTTWPLLLDCGHRPDPRQFSQWGGDDNLGFARDLLPHLGPPDRTAFLTRLPVIWITLLLAALVFRWADGLWRGWAGYLALFLFVFDPTVAAHARLNTTDMGLAAFGFLSSYALVCYLQRPSARRLLWAGLALGLPLASKASGPFYLMMAVLLLIVYGMVAWRRQRRWVWRVLSAVAALIGLALFVLWAACLFEVRPLAPGGLALPAASYWAGLPYIRSYLPGGQTSFFWGHLYTTNPSRAYFPVAFLLKTPLPTLLLLVLAVGEALTRCRCRSDRVRFASLLVLIAMPVAYFLATLAASLQIGQRHLLPVYPFLFVFISRLARPAAVARWTAWPAPRRWLSALSTLVLLAWLASVNLSLQPFQISYFNELAGGPSGGYRYLADSSADWGQALKALRRYLDEQAADEVRLAAFSSLDPTLYGLRFTPLPPTVGAPITLTARFNPPPGLYAISVTPLQGLWLLDPDTYDAFRHRQPVARVGYVFFIYNVEPATPAPQWVAQCAAPVPPLDVHQIVVGFGRTDLRLAAFDCRAGWLYPAGAGWTVLPDEVLDEWAAERLTGVPLTFHQRRTTDHLALSVYEGRGRPEGASPPGLQVRIAPAEWSPQRVADSGISAIAPVVTDGPLTFLGYDLQPASSASELEVRTYWRVVEGAARPLSLMAHLVAADGAPVAIADGLAVPIEFWRPDDVIVQRHRFALPEEASDGEYWLRLGGYWLDTMERWRIGDAREADALWVLVARGR
jgi:4-amino-4-deoxy-L-arabinose transferase-like glycosyltransferase